MVYGHISNHIHNKGLRTDNTLHVLAVVSNPVRFQSRYRLFRSFVEEMKRTSCVKLYLVETAFGDRELECVDISNSDHLGLRSDQEIWVKESMINLGSRLLPRDWKYLAWVDADISFVSPGWAQETLHQLQHYPVVQPWSECADLGPHGSVLQMFESFASIHRKRLPKQRHPLEPYKYAHSGFAWACTRYFWENTGGLMDFPILGSSDHHMAWAMTGRVDETIHNKMPESFFRRCREWQSRACHVTHGDNLGYVKGLIHHHWHGKKKDRKYRERWDIMIENHFDPDKHIAHDSQGLVKVVNNNSLLSDVRDYFRQRSEDSIDEY